MKRVLITGASGFIGNCLILSLKKNKNFITRVVTRKSESMLIADEIFIIQGIDKFTEWQAILKDVDVVVHLAGRAHILNDTADNPLKEFIEINYNGTINLARQSVKANIKRFIFISSIGVNGSKKKVGIPLSTASSPNPDRAYATSKLMAEIALEEISIHTNMEVTIIRPPLVYGSNAPGNFEKLMTAIVEGKYLPLGSINNKRSFIYLDNLVDLIICCLTHPKAANETFMVSDNRDLSTTELVNLMYKSLKLPSKLISIPERLLYNFLILIGKKELAQSLCDSQQADITKTFKLLGWQPAVKMEAAFAKTAQHFLDKRVNKP